jgi:hypothetical protein
MAMAFQVRGDERMGFSNDRFGKAAEQFCVA